MLRNTIKHFHEYLSEYFDTDTPYLVAYWSLMIIVFGTVVWWVIFCISSGLLVSTNTL